MNSEDNESFESNKTIMLKNDSTNNALMTQSMTSSITSERLEIKRNTNEENQNHMRSDDDSINSVKIKKYMPKPRNNYTMSMVKLQQLQMEEETEPLKKISKTKVVAAKKQAKTTAVAWVNPDGSLDGIDHTLGLQPRRNCRNKARAQLPPADNNDWHNTLLELEKEVKPMAVHKTRSTNSSPLRNAQAMINPAKVANELSCVPINVPAVNRTKKKKTRGMTQKNANTPMKAFTLDKELYEQILQINMTEIDVISTEITMDLDTANNVKKSPTRSNSPTQLQRSRSFTLSSGKYDPFLSAKRQFEELCSPTTTMTSNSTPTTPLPQNKSMTTSLNFATSTPNSRQASNKGTSSTLQQNNFRRTSSLRVPRRSPLLSSRPIFNANYRPTIQRGLSDEGPISTNFLKPEEYDEMPVRSVCVNDFAMTKSPRVIRRDLNATLNRKPHIKLNLQTNNNSNTNKSPDILEEKEMHNKLLNSTIEVKEASKTDSLAVFLKYEHELEKLASHQEEKIAEETKSIVENPMVSKDLKNKNNNAITKQNSNKNVPETNFYADKMPLILPLETKFNTEQQQPQQLQQSNKNLAMNERNKLPQLPLMKTKAQVINLNAIFGDSSRLTSSENIDPKLINKCDNLPLNLKQLHQNATQNQHKILTPPSPPPRKQTQQHITTTTTPIHVGTGNRLKRKMRLGLNQFLYDTSPDELEDDTTDSTESGHKSLLKSPSVLPVFDDLDFDFEEFISSFEQDNEQFPLFKDCKEFLSNRSTNKQRSAIATNSTQLPIIKPLTFETFSPQQKIFDCEEKDTRKREIFISIEAEQSDCGQSPLSPASLRNIVGNAQTVVDVHEVGATNEAKFSKISDDDGDADESAIVDSEDNSLPNVKLNNAKNLIQRMKNDDQQQQQQAAVSHQREDTPVHFEKYERQVSGYGDEDSDDLGNANMLNMTRNSRRSINTKISADSAYGSLSRQRSTELCTPQARAANQTRPSTANLPMPTVKVLHQHAQQQQQQFYKTKHNKARSNQYVYKGSSSNSGSDTSLPAVEFQKNFNQLPVTNKSNSNIHNYDLEPQQSQQQQQGNRLRRNNSRNLDSLHTQNNNNNNNNNNKNTNNKNSQNNVNESQISEVLMMSSASNLNLESPMTSSTSSNPSMSSSACKRMSKFCHECGSKFIVEQAKFCMDCGVKRIIL